MERLKASMQIALAANGVSRDSTPPPGRIDWAAMEKVTELKAAPTAPATVFSAGCLSGWAAGRMSGKGKRWRPARRIDSDHEDTKDTKERAPCSPLFVCPGRADVPVRQFFSYIRAKRRRGREPGVRNRQRSSSRKAPFFPWCPSCLRGGIRLPPPPRLLGAGSGGPPPPRRGGRRSWPRPVREPCGRRRR